jgi:hypothetical protein
MIPKRVNVKGRFVMEFGEIALQTKGDKDASDPSSLIFATKKQNARSRLRVKRQPFGGCDITPVDRKSTQEKAVRHTKRSVIYLFRSAAPETRLALCKQALCFFHSLSTKNTGSLENVFALSNASPLVGCCSSLAYELRC